MISLSTTTEIFENLTLVCDKLKIDYDEQALKKLTLDDEETARKLMEDLTNIRLKPHLSRIMDKIYFWNEATAKMELFFLITSRFGTSFDLGKPEEWQRILDLFPYFKAFLGEDYQSLRNAAIHRNEPCFPKVIQETLSRIETSFQMDWWRQFSIELVFEVRKSQPFVPKKNKKK